MSKAESLCGCALRTLTLALLSSLPHLDSRSAAHCEVRGGRRGTRDGAAQDEEERARMKTAAPRSGRLCARCVDRSSLLLDLKGVMAKQYSWQHGQPERLRVTHPSIAQSD